MKIIFFGTSKFAVPSLKKIIGSKHKIAAVVTQPDRKSGRNLKLAAPPVKEAVRNEKIPVLQPSNASSQETIERLKKYKAEIFVVVSFGQILKKELLLVPEKFAINLHASLLPKYRGAGPVNWAVMKGEKATGCTIIRMNEKMDRGEIILKNKIPIEGADTTITLNEKLSVSGAELLLEAIDGIGSGKAKFTKQDEKKATYAPKLTKEDGLIDWSMSAADIHNRIRGLIPWPGAYTHWQKKLLKIWDAAVSAEKTETGGAGRILKADDSGITVGTGEGAVMLKTIQLEGKKRMSSADFLHGHPLKPGDNLT